MSRSRVSLYPYAGPGGRNYIKQDGTLADLRRYGVELVEGLVLDFYSDDADDDGRRDDLVFKGSVHHDAASGQWFVLVDEASYHHGSEE
jgi:hypothetical protein